MNLHISENIDRAIEGFTTIPLMGGSVDLTNIPNNCCENIIAEDAIDQIKAEKIEDFLVQVSTKMRNNCHLMLGGTDLYLLSRELIHNKIDILGYNSAIYSKQGVYSAEYITSFLGKLNIIVKSCVFKGLNYEISATRTIG